MKTALENVMQTIITASWNVESNGDVESPTGHFAVVEVPEHDGELTDIVDAIKDMVDSAELVALCTLTRGFYQVMEDIQGNVFVSGPCTESQAKTWFAGEQDAFIAWMDADDEDQ